MFEGDLHLPRRVFGNGRARRNPLELAGAVEIGKEGFDLLKLAQSIDLCAARTPAIDIPCRLRPAIAVALLIQQVELQFRRHDRVIAVSLQPFDDFRQ
ncbi:hypothetical protein D3C78_583670 [compost metagenome]